MFKKKKKTNSRIVPTIVFFLILAISLLLFFGLETEAKSSYELVSFAFIIFTELVISGSVIVPSFIDYDRADVVSAGLLYAIMSFIVNVLFTFETIRELFVYNLCAVLVYGIILTVFVYAKNK